MSLDKIITKFRSLTVVSQALKALKSGLSPSLRYHTYAHTDDVLHEALLFATTDSRTERELELLAIAAAWHDAGFLEALRENEEVGAHMASEAMRSNGSYSEQEIDLVSQMIRDTQVKFTERGPCQSPSTELSRYLLDGDVSNLGRKDFFEKANLVLEEVAVLRVEDFYQGLVTFMDAHSWHSPAAIKLRTEGKVQNVAELLKIISERRFPKPPQRMKRP